eukprot:884997-Pleurochrysis_carterae.AAC.1
MKQALQKALEAEAGEEWAALGGRRGAGGTAARARGGPPRPLAQCVAGRHHSGAGGAPARGAEDGNGRDRREAARGYRHGAVAARSR